MRLIYGDKTSFFEELWEQDKSFSIHTRKLQIMVTKMFKVYLCLLLYRDISCNLPSNSIFPVPNVKSTFHGSKSISYLGPKTCGILTLEQKECLQKNIKKWQRKNCFCRVHLKYFRKVFLKKYFRKLFLTFMLFSTHFRLLPTSYTPLKHRKHRLLKYSVGMGRDHFV